MQTIIPSWYCARTKPKHDHIAAANVRKNLGLEVFHPQLRLERATKRGVVRVVEPLFPCYIFVRCVLEESLSDIQYTAGVSSLVRFGCGIPTIADSVVEELQECFESTELMTIQDHLSPGSEVVMAEGAFAGMSGVVLRLLPARRRVQVLLDFLGRPTPVEVPRASIAIEKDSMADRIPLLAAAYESV